MSAGSLRRRAKVYEMVRISDGAGGWEEDWQEWDTVWVGWSPLRPRERMEAMAQNLEIAGMIRMRYREGVPVPARFEIGGRVYESEGGAMDWDDRRRYLLFAVHEPQDGRVYQGTTEDA